MANISSIDELMKQINNANFQYEKIINKFSKEHKELM